MSRESIPRAFLIFLVDLPKAFRSHCWVFMLLGLGSYVYVGHRLSAAISSSPELKQSTAGAIITIALIMLWLIAFGLGVKNRPDRPERLYLYPPLPVIMGSFICGSFFILLAGGVMGNLIGVGTFKSLQYTFVGLFVVPILTMVLFKLTLGITVMGVQMRKDRSVILADAYRGMWLFPALSAIVMYGSSRLLGVELAYADANVLTIIWSPLTSAVFSSGFASGYYP